ncbi:unnamed protein product [Rotaria socialis]|uniref:Uncharacterized protein n=1 Tax=Rotaria socialis TaxID=392032 RepID=A0A817YDU6_9BILA|nr:unnamed protein product [Rotaria socialis]CAF3556776.1 unnamed protein product [Rotaria socialis]CAF3576201.1 unnamed protein product [Rotaria socialis]
MNGNNEEVFITTVPNDEEDIAFGLSDGDDLNIDIKSSVDSDEESMVDEEIEDIFNKKQHQDISLLSIAKVESVDVIENNTLMQETSSLSLITNQTQTAISKSVYDYATVVRQTLKTPRQNKLDHDIATVLGSSDPPPGFGFLHPQFYYLEQTRPVPLEPLQASILVVWRGYNGHVYFSPIQVRQFENQPFLSSTKFFKSVAAQSVPLIRKTGTDRSNTILSQYKDRKTITRTDFNISQLNNNEHLLAKKKPPSGTPITDDNLITSSSELQYSTSVSFLDKDDCKQEFNRMWQSVVTCAHVQAKPISKRSRHAMEDLQALQQEQSVQDPTGYNRQVLPNIRPVPKSKFVYKGLAYKETQKLPGITNGTGNDNDGNALQKPLVAYNLAQAYARYEINAARAKHGFRQPPPSAVTAAVLKDQSSPLQTSVDLREMRKRIVRGTTLAYRPPPQSVAWTPGRADHRSTLGSETAHRRPSTSKSSIPQKQTTVIEMPIVTKNINQPRSSSRFTTTSELFAGVS